MGARAHTVRLKGRDAMWTVAVIDPIVVPIVRLLVPVRAVTPNRLTLLAFVLSAASAVAFAFDRLLIGAIVVQIAFWVDCVDGKLLSARGEENPLGRLFDEIGDALRIVLNATGLVIATVGGSEVAPAALTAYVGLRFALHALAESRPNQREVTYVEAPLRALAVLRLAPRRTTPPATTVEVELLVFTIAPLLGHDAITVGALVAVGVESAHYGKYVLQVAAEARRRRRLMAAGGRGDNGPG